MAKRRRLTPPQDAPYADPAGRNRTARPPIAQVAGDVAAHAALAEMGETLQQARDEGRMVLSLPLDAVIADHIPRDRVEVDDTALVSLRDSIAARGQQVPIEVVACDNGQYGLISGWRRLMALRHLHDAAGAADGAAFGHVLAFLRHRGKPEDIYVAMVEENEIRADLSFWERARIVHRTVEGGIFITERTALQTLFANASFARRSKIKSFVPLVRAFDGVLRHPTRITERLGLALSRRLAEDPCFAEAVKEQLQAAPDPSPESEARILATAVRAPDQPDKPSKAAQEIAPGITLRRSPSGLRLEGPGVTDDLVTRLRGWLSGT